EVQEVSDRMILATVVRTLVMFVGFVFFFSSRRRHTISKRDWSSDVCSSDLKIFVLIYEAIRKSYSFTSLLTLSSYSLTISKLLSCDSTYPSWEYISRMIS